MIFSDSEYDFLQREFGLDRASVDKLDNDGLSELQDECFEIEGQEINAVGNNELSERGKTAVRLVDLIHGPYDSSEYDAEMAAMDDEDDYVLETDLVSV